MMYGVQKLYVNNTTTTSLCDNTPGPAKDNLRVIINNYYAQEL